MTCAFEFNGMVGVAAILLLVVLMLPAAGCSSTPAPHPAAPSDEKQPQHLSTVTIRVADIPLTVEVARTQTEREKGMMFRTKLGPDEAMLFVFERPANLVFWMKNTPVDLDLAYLGDDGEILQTASLTAYDLTPVYSGGPARFALELPAGWLEAHHVAEGAKVSIPPSVVGEDAP